MMNKKNEFNKESRLSYLRLDANENLSGPSPRVIERLRGISAKEMASYPEYDALYAKLAGKLGVGSDQLLVSAGADEALLLIFQQLLTSGDEVVLLEPGFSQYKILCDQVDAKVKWIGCEKIFPSEQLLAAIGPDTRLVVIASPNNPTGTVAPQEVLQEVARHLTGGFLVIDEAYAEFAAEDNLNWVTGCQNVCLVRTFSKAYGLAGYRVGYAVGFPQLIRSLRIYQQPYSVSRLAVEAAITALDDQPYVEGYVAEVANGRVRLIAALQAMDFDVWPSAANFVWVDFGDRAEEVFEQLHDARILVRRLPAWPAFLRLTVGNQMAVEGLINALQRILTEPKVVLFDMDGVLVDERNSYRRCISETVAAFIGTSPSIKEVDAIKAGGGVNDDFDCVAALLFQAGMTVSREAIVEKFESLYWGINGDGLIRNEQWIMPAEVLRRLRGRYRLGIVTGRPRRDAEAALNRFGMRSMFDVVVTADDVAKGKPDPEGVRLALQSTNAIQAVYIGDLIDDMRAAEAAGIRFLAVVPPGRQLERFKQMLPAAEILEGAQSLLELLMSETERRETSVCRITTETAIELTLNLDGSGDSRVDTRIGFLDHMLASFSKHGLFDLDLLCRGDLEIDQHHTVEDVGICLGEAVRRSLGDKRGIARTGFFVFPMDEARATCAVDLSGRAVLIYELVLNDGRIGDFDLVNLKNFFEGFVQGARCNLQLEIPTGRDPHHMVEALFKAFGKAMRMACAKDERSGDCVPSTKGAI